MRPSRRSSNLNQPTRTDEGKLTHSASASCGDTVHPPVPIDGVTLTVVSNFRTHRIPNRDGLCVCRDKEVEINVSMPPETWSQRSEEFIFVFEWVVRIFEPSSSGLDMETATQVLAFQWTPGEYGFSALVMPGTIPKGTSDSVAEFQRKYKRELKLRGSAKPCTFLRVKLFMAGPLSLPLVAHSEKLYVSSGRNMRQIEQEALADAESLELLKRAFERGEFRPAPVLKGYLPVKSDTTKEGRKSKKRKTVLETEMSNPESQKLELLKRAFERGEFRPAPDTTKEERKAKKRKAVFETEMSNAESQLRPERDRPAESAESGRPSTI